MGCRTVRKNLDGTIPTNVKESKRDAAHRTASLLKLMQLSGHVVV